MWLCRCECGNENSISGSHLRQGRSTQCCQCADIEVGNKLTAKIKGQLFGRWKVIKYYSTNKRGQAIWLCQCECGNEKPISGSHLRQGKSTQCRPCADIEVGKKLRRK
jgi:hypothetical protein